MLKINETKKENVGARLRPCPNKGITLIALIITIIIMLILVAVTITVAVNGGLFEYAGRAGKETNEAIEKEQELASLEEGLTVDQLIEKYTIPNYADANFENGLLTSNAKYTSGAYSAIIPKGFAISNVKEEQTIANGLVITDKVDEQGNSIGNEFVWIPVNYTATGTLDSNGLDSGFLSVFYVSDWVADDTNGGKRGTTKGIDSEPATDGYVGESEDYYEMMRSVQKNKGFYIGRYEAGIKTTENPRTSTMTGLSNMVVQRDAYPYTYVSWGNAWDDYTSDVVKSQSQPWDDPNGTNYGKGAVFLSKELYGKTEDERKYGVVSTLCYDVQWNAMLDFVKDLNHNVHSSTRWGNYKDNLWLIDRQTAMYSEDNGETWRKISDRADKKLQKNEEKTILLTTGASDTFAAKNIYDVAGNIVEMVMSRHWKGGICMYPGELAGAYINLAWAPYYLPNDLGGFRSALYIK